MELCTVSVQWGEAETVVFSWNYSSVNQELKIVTSVISNISEQSISYELYLY